MRGGGAALGAALLCASVWGSASAAEDIGALVAPYLTGLSRALLGEVVGTARADAPTPTGPPVPYGAVAVMLVPYSAAFEQELDRIKAGLRDSLRSYADGAVRAVAAREAYERALLAAGAGELVRGEVSDVAGRFRFSGVPAGDWLLLAWWNVEHPVRGRRLQKREAGHFTDNPERVGSTAVMYWRMRLHVPASEVVAVTLSDRNGWMTGVREELRLPGSPGDAAKRRQGTTR